MEVLQVSQKDLEFVILYFEDVFGAALKQHNYNPDRQSLLLHFADDAELEKALSTQVYVVDDAQKYRVQRQAVLPHHQQQAEQAHAKVTCISMRSSKLPHEVMKLDLTSEAEQRIELAIPNATVGRLIGKNGVQIKALQEQTRCRINVEKSYERNGDSVVVIRGSQDQIEDAREQIQSIVHRTLSKPLLSPKVLTDRQKCCVRVPADQCKHVVGKGGKNIREICAKSGARIDAPKKGSSNDHGVFVLAGTDEQIQSAVNLMSSAARMTLQIEDLQPDLVSSSELEHWEFGQGENAQRSIEVTGISRSITKRCLKLYFEDEQLSAGGIIESLSYFEDRGRAIIMYQDPRAAARVASQSHLIRGCAVNVSLWNSVGHLSSHADDDRRLFLPRHRAPQRSASKIPSGPDGRVHRTSTWYTMLISGIDCNTCSEALACWLRLALGSFPHTLCYTATDGKAVATFDEEGVNMRNMSAFVKKNSMDGQLLIVQRLAPSAAMQVHSSTVELTQAFLGEQFKTAESIKTMLSRLAVVRFPSCDHAWEAVQQLKQSGNDSVWLAPYYDDIGIAPEDGVFRFDLGNSLRRPVPATAMQQLVVTGVAADLDVNLLESFFSNATKTGGGKIKSLMHCNDRAVITYFQAEDCDKVLKKSKSGVFNFCDRELQVSIRSFDATGHHRDKVLLRNIAEATFDSIKYLVWAVGDSPVQSVNFIRLHDNKELCALVQLAGPANFTELSHGLQALTLNGIPVELDVLPLSCSVLVRNVPTNAHKDTVDLAFSKSRTVKSCEPTLVPGVWKVTFNNPSDAMNALTEPVAYGSGTNLDVCQCETYEIEHMPYRRSRRELLLSFVPPMVLKFVLAKRLTEFNDILQRCGCSCERLKDSDRYTVALIRPPHDPEYRKLSKEWPHVRSKLSSYFQNFSTAVVTLDVIQPSSRNEQLHSRLQTLVVEGQASSDVIVEMQEDAGCQKAFHLAGKKDAVSNFTDRLHIAAAEIKDNLEKQVVVKKGLDDWFIKLLSRSGFPQSFSKKTMDVQAIPHPAQREYTFIGAKADVDWAVDKMHELQSRAVTDTFMVSAAYYRLISGEVAQACIQDALAAASLSDQAVWLAQPPSSVNVYALNMMAAKKATAVIKGEMFEKKIPLTVQSDASARQSDASAWKEALRHAKDKYGGKMEAELEEAADGSRYVLLVCVKSASDGITREIRQLIGQNTVDQRCYRLHPLVLAYLNNSIHVVKQLEQAQAQNFVSVSLNESPSECTLSVRGNCLGTDAFIASLKSKLNCHQLSARTLVLRHPGADRYFASKVNAEVLQSIAQRTQTVVRLGKCSSAQVTLPEQDTESCFLKHQFPLACGRQLIVVQGSMVDIDCDVMVSSTNGRLDHCSGLAKVLAEAGGEAVMSACRRLLLRRGVIGEGEVVETESGLLSCKLLVHAICPVWRGGSQDEETKLAGVISASLQLADEKGYTSLALPALGCGSNGYPPDQAVRIIVNSVKAFLLKKPQAALKTVTFVDILAEHKRLFCSAVKTIFSVTSAVSVDDESMFASVKMLPTAPVPATRNTTNMVNKDGITRTAHHNIQSGKVAENNAGIVVSLVQGTLEHQQADIYVSPVAADLNLQRGRVSQALSMAAGPGLQSELVISKPHGIAEGDIAVTEGYSLRCSKVIHALCPEARHHSNSEELLVKLIRKCFSTARLLQKSSIAMPAVGTGHGHFSADVAARAMSAAVQKYGRDHPHTSLNITVVINDPPMMPVYQNALSTTSPVNYALSSSTGQSPDAKGRGEECFEWRTKQLQDAATTEQIQPVTSALSLTTCGASVPAIARAETLIEEHCTQSMQTKTLDLAKYAMHSLTDQQFDDMLAYAQKMSVDLSRGTSRDGNVAVVLRSLDAERLADVHQLFTEALLRENIAKLAEEDLQKRTQWQYLGSRGTWCDYSPSLNVKLEDARKAGMPVVTYVNQFSKFTVHIDQLVDVCAKGSHVKVRRRDNTPASRPETWSAETSYHEVILDRRTTEYQEVSAAFANSIASQRVIIEIKRIQNPSLWQQYAALKKKMEDSASLGRPLQLERFLWHGAPQETVPAICHDRFDRSHSGKNAVAYGQGVYFARDASYSAQDVYSAPNSAGEKHIIYCQVLTGEYERGSSAMRVPNLKPGQSLLRYDSTTNSTSDPSIFVTYHDAQAYPAYVIKFK